MPEYLVTMSGQFAIIAKDEEEADRLSQKVDFAAYLDDSKGPSQPAWLKDTYDLTIEEIKNSEEEEEDEEEDC